jgi:hypothetical protein
MLVLMMLLNLLKPGEVNSGGQKKSSAYYFSIVHESYSGPEHCSLAWVLVDGI